MISFLLPWFKKMPYFRLTLAHNAAVFSNDAEVVIAMDEPSEEAELLEFIRQWPGIRFTVLVNQQEHDWRPPTKAINVAARHSVGDSLIVISPETVLRLPRPDYLHGHKFALGLLWNIELPEADGNALADRLRQYGHLWPPANFGYGFIQVPTWAFDAIRGYDESRSGVSGDDNDFRIRLMRFGMQFTVNPEIHAVHIWHPNPLRTTTFQAPKVTPIADLREWGRDFDTIAYSWKKP